MSALQTDSNQQSLSQIVFYEDSKNCDFQL